jgi:hypothetical protein
MTTTEFDARIDAINAQYPDLTEEHRVQAAENSDGIDDDDEWLEMYAASLEGIQMELDKEKRYAEWHAKNKADQSSEAYNHGYAEITAHCEQHGVTSAQKHFHATQSTVYKRYLDRDDSFECARQWFDGGLSALLDFHK